MPFYRPAFPVSATLLPRRIPFSSNRSPLSHGRGSMLPTGLLRKSLPARPPQGKSSDQLRWLVPPKLGSFCVFRPPGSWRATRLGSFRTVRPPGRRPLPGRAKLGLFRTIGPSGVPARRGKIGFVWHLSPVGGLALPKRDQIGFVSHGGRARAGGGRARGRRPAAGLSSIRNCRIAFVPHDGPMAASYFKHRTSHFKLLLSMCLPLLRAVLQESVRKNGWRHPPKSP
jgi:hypothetical protein